MLEELENVNTNIRSQVVGSVYEYVKKHDLHEFVYPLTRQQPTDLQSDQFTRQAYRRTLCGMLKYLAENDVNSNLYHYVTIHTSIDKGLIFEELQTNSCTYPFTAYETNFIFEYQQVDKTLFFLATLTHASQILQICSVMRSNYEAYMGGSMDYKELVDAIESYVHLHTPGVVTLVTRYTDIPNLSMQFSTFDNFVSVLVSYSELSTATQVIKRKYIQKFTTIQLLLAVQCVHKRNANSLDLLLDEVNYIDEINQIIPPLSNLEF
jgi:hypothetical protein